MEVAMSPIQTESSFGNVDCLDGVPLKPWESLRVQFPDGHEEEHKVIVKESYKADSPWVQPITHVTAYLNIEYHGVKRWIPAKGLLAERI